MNKRLIGALGLSVIMASQCIYAQEFEMAHITEIEQEHPLRAADDEAVFETIKGEIAAPQNNVSNIQEDLDNRVDLETTVGVEEQANINKVDNLIEQTNIHTSINSEEQNTESDSEELINAVGIADIDSTNKVILQLNSTKVMVDGLERTLLTPPTVIEGTTLLPMRFVGETVLGAQVDWNQATKTVTMQKNGTTVSVTIGSKKAIIDGLEVELQVAPIIKNNTTLVPVRFLSEAFGIRVDYDSKTKIITIDKGSQNGTQVPEVAPNQAPVAAFHFPQEYVAGQVVSVINDSYDPDGDAIKDQLWAIQGDKIVTNRELSNMFKTPRAGVYTIGLKVQDAKGLWSDWTYQTITILPNQAPVITSLNATKSSFAQGETIDFLPYTYENESWETVTEGKWTYRKVGEAANRATLGKPNVLFAEGDYIVTLYLDDAYGNRSAGYETTIHITNEVRNTELNYKFSAGMVGEWIDNFAGINYLNYKPVDVIEKSYVDGTLIMSDSPEEVKGRGILYRDSINGTGRLLIHHINQSDSIEKQRLAIIVENPTENPITVQLKNKAIKGPSNDILRVGQLCLNEYLSGKIPTETITLQPGERKYIYDKAWNVNMGISAHVDVETTGEAKFIIANLNASDNLQSIDGLYYYPADGAHYSGTYDKVGIKYNLKLSGKEAEKLTIGTAHSGEWIVGYDERTGMPVANAGNFGISHYITVTAEEDMGVILNNRGGMFKGAIKWNDQVFDVPGKGSFSGTTTKAVVLGTIKKGETVTIEYLLPNGSAAPTLIGFIPKSQW